MKSGGGVPAHFIRFRVEDEIVRKELSKLGWWNLDEKRRGRLIDRYRISLDGIASLKER